MTIVINDNLIKLRGLVRWASVPPAEPKKPHEDAYDPKEPDNCFWSIEVECTDAELSQILALIGKKPGDAFAQRLREYKEDVLSKASGEVMAAKTDKKFLTVKKTKKKGTYDFGTLPVKDIAGADLTDVGIGNDSTAIVHVVVEPVKKGSTKKTLRLKGVQVLELKPFALSSKDANLEIDLVEESPHAQQEAYSQDLTPPGDVDEFGF